MTGAALDERRRIERELHDGPLQQLVALGVELQLARQLVEPDSDELGRRLDKIQGHVHEALDELRQLCWRIYPSLLLDLGLAEALRAAASEAAIPTRVEVTAMGRHPPTVEATVYLCCVELLRAAAQAGAGARATVRAQAASGALRFEVLVAEGEKRWEPGDLGVAGDRLAALGGQLAISSEAERVCVTGTIPVDR